MLNAKNSHKSTKILNKSCFDAECIYAGVYRHQLVLHFPILWWALMHFRSTEPFQMYWIVHFKRCFYKLLPTLNFKKSWFCLAVGPCPSLSSESCLNHRWFANNSLWRYNQGNKNVFTNHGWFIPGSSVSPSLF